MNVFLDGSKPTHFIKTIVFNWFSDSQNGEQFTSYFVGNNGVTEIVEHQAGGDGDKWFYDVHFENGKVHRIFNVNEIFIEPKI